MITTVIYDDFYPAPIALQKVARSLDFGPQEYKGHTYTGIGRGYEPEKIWGYISVMLGKVVRPELEYFRLGTATEKPTTYIHADGICANSAAVLYLSEAPDGIQAGTAFWKHKETGLYAAPDEKWIRSNIGDSADAVAGFLSKINSDGNDESKWVMTDLVGQRFNRIVTYPSNIFHSRYPQAAWGNDVNDGRLVWTGFFHG